MKVYMQQYPFTTCSRDVEVMTLKGLIPCQLHWDSVVATISLQSWLPQIPPLWKMEKWGFRQARILGGQQRNSPYNIPIFFLLLSLIQYYLKVTLYFNLCDNLTCFAFLKNKKTMQVRTSGIRLLPFLKDTIPTCTVFSYLHYIISLKRKKWLFLVLAREIEFPWESWCRET